MLDAARARVSQLRRDAARDRLMTFARTYLPGHFRLEPSPMHLEVAGLLEQGALARGQRLAIAAPRGHAKSTLVSLALTLWSICYERERFIQIISDTADQAVDLLAAVKGELEANELLREDFPGACELPGRPPGPERWKKSDIIARNKVRILALGAEQKVRGRRHGADRPSLIILDDIENEALARSAEQREGRWRWLTGSVLSSGSATTNIIAVGTVLHHDSVLARLLDPRRTHAWTTRRYRAITAWAERKDLWQAWEGVYGQMDEYEGRTGPEAARAYFEARREAMLVGSGVLWPQLEDYHGLMAQRMQMARKHLVRAIAQAHHWAAQLRESGDKPVRLNDVATRAGVAHTRVDLLLPLAHLAPEVVRAVLSGTLPATVSLKDLVTASHHRDWCRQALQLGLAVSEKH